MFTELRRRKEKYSKNFNKDSENVRKYQAEVTELANNLNEKYNRNNQQQIR